MRYRLYYWPIPFRGHPIRFALAEAGMEWQEFSFEDVVELKDRPAKNKPYPFFAPPALHDLETDTWISQMPAVAMYVGRQHGLTKDPAQTLRILCDAADVYLEITCNHGAQMWNSQSWAEFRSHRLPLWLQTHEAVANAGEAFLYGNEPSLADFALAALWHTMVDRLPPLRDDLHNHAPTLERLVDTVANRPRIAALRSEWDGRKPHYCGGQIEASLLSVLGITP